MNLCMCGCDTPVAVKFVRGHDGKLMSRLYRAAREGMMPIIYEVAYAPESYAGLVSPAFAGHLAWLVAGARR